MLKLHAVQAGRGDCLIVEFGTDQSPKYILIDGAPPENYKDLEKAIKKIVTTRKLEKLILSHVDIDHIGGLLSLFYALRRQSMRGEELLVTIKDLWINEFSSVFGNNLETQMMQMFNVASAAIKTMGHGNIVFQGIAEGHKLQADANVLGIPINEGVNGSYVSLEHVDEPLTIGNIQVTVVGPTQENLDELQRKWEEWLENHKEALETGGAQALSNADQSIPNLSSIILLVEGGGKSMLLTGDCRADHLEQGLKKRGLSDADGKFHVDLLKVQHHGSDRNITKAFLKRVTADVYVFSADGKHGNPDYKTLQWLVEAAHEDGRSIEIHVTNKTDSTKAIVQDYPPNKYGYTIDFMKVGHYYISFDLA